MQRQLIVSFLKQRTKLIFVLKNLHFSNGVLIELQIVNFFLNSIFIQIKAYD